MLDPAAIPEAQNHRRTMMSEIIQVALGVICWLVCGACGSGMVLLHFRKRYDSAEKWTAFHSLMSMLGVINLIAALIALNLDRRFA